MQCFSWKLTKSHEIDLKLTSELGKIWSLKILHFFLKTHESAKKILELGKLWSLKIRYFFMKTHECAWKRLKSHIWTGKRVITLKIRYCSRRPNGPLPIPLISLCILRGPCVASLEGASSPKDWESSVCSSSSCVYWRVAERHLVSRVLDRNLRKGCVVCLATSA
jgi:hypothetical protein